MQKSFLPVVMIFVFCNATASAAVISVDDGVFGVDSITLDTDQGLEFLDVTFSADRSFDDVSSHLGAGGNFEGFRYATEDEVILLVNNFGFSPSAVAGGQVLGNTGNDQLSGLVDLLGATQPFFHLHAETIGITATLDGADQRFVRIRDNFSGDDLVGSNFAVSPSFQNSEWGSFLVRPVAAVPEPSSLTIVLTLFSGILIARRFRRRPRAS